MDDTTHFDRRGSNYDQDETHKRIVELLLAPFAFAPGERILDLATGTGLVALQVAKLVGSSGQVVGLDSSAGMLAVARRGAEEMRLANVRFEQGHAEYPRFEASSFDRLILRVRACVDGGHQRGAAVLARPSEAGGHDRVRHPGQALRLFTEGFRSRASPRSEPIIWRNGGHAREVSDLAGSGRS